jgi:hypothetical protein
MGGDVPPDTRDILGRIPTLVPRNPNPNLKAAATVDLARPGRPVTHGFLRVANMRRPAQPASPKVACLIQTDPLPKLGQWVSFNCGD